MNPGARTGPLVGACLLIAGVMTAAVARAAPAPARAETDAIRAALAAMSWAQAESLAQVSLARASSPVDSADLIAPLLLARWRNDRERTPGTLALAERALAIRQRTPGRDSIPLAVAWEGMAYGLAGSGRHREADAPVEAALGIRLRNPLGRLDAEGSYLDTDIVRLRHLHGVLASHRGDYAECVRRFSIEVDERERLAPRDTIELARAHMSLASSLTSRGDRTLALTHFERALALFDSKPGAADRDKLYAMNTLVTTLGSLDRLSEAVELAHDAVELAERSLGPDHPQTGYAHRGLGYTYSMLGDYASAREEAALAVDILTRAYGASNDQVAQTRRLLAVYASKSGDFETALPIAQDVLRTLESTPGTTPQKIVDAMNSVAYALNGLGRRAESMATLERALALCDRELGPQNAGTPFMMANLGGAYLDSGLVNRAESLFVIARARSAARTGLEHSSQVQFLRGLAIASATRKDWPHAESLLTAAVSIARATSGGNPQDLGPSLMDRARVRADAGNAEAAVKDALEAAALHLEHQRLLADGLSEREALRFAAADPSGLPIAVSIGAAHALPAEREQAVWDAVIRSRARVMDDMAERLHFAVVAASSESLATGFRNASADLGAAILRGASRARCDSLRKRREAFEIALARESARWRGDRTRARLGYAEVRAALPSGAALVGFVRHPRGHASDARGRMRPVAGYTVLVLAAGQDDIRILSLGDAGPIDSLVARWNALASRPPPADAEQAKRAESKLRTAGEQLRARVWDPVRKLLGDASLALVVPDGALQLVSPGTLPDGRGWLAEHTPTLHMLTAERDLVREADTRAGAGLLAIGAPDFDAAQSEASAVVAMRGARPQCERFQELRFPPLPGSRAETEAVVAEWRRSRFAAESAQSLMGSEASEARLKREAGGHRVLHLATHGFYLDFDCVAAAARGRGVSGLAEWTPAPTASGASSKPAAKPAKPTAPSPSASNPLVLGGLVLSGANHRDASPAEDDGVLTAQEIAALDLRGTELAVLSSCRGGVGEPQDGQGVSGLRRAFREAGVKTVISSVWPVGDDDARAWMDAFYRRRLAEGASTASAVREASLERLRALRAQKRATPPIVWGAFFASGDWQ